MKRITMKPRSNWQERVANVGMNYHTIDGKEYWNESAAYVFTSKEVNAIEDATQELHHMCLVYVDSIVKSGFYDPAYGFDDYTISLIERSWNAKHKSLYGRFDLGMDKRGNIKMFEYNADTPTSLLEASVIQWNWLKEVVEDADQYNSIHEKLIAHWKNWEGRHIHLAAMRESPIEDWGNTHYLLETAIEAGLNASSLDIETIGWNSHNRMFVDNNDNHIETLFKLYPWEWFMHDEFYPNIAQSLTQFIEPPWKMLLSNKLLCVNLKTLFPDCPYLLEAYREEPKKKWFFNKNWIKKPYLGREGQGVTLGKQEPLTIAQEYFKVQDFNGIEPVIGSWVIGDMACGMGIREDNGITTNNSCFVPHYFE